jgi:hypothetical protein
VLTSSLAALLSACRELFLQPFAYSHCPAAAAAHAANLQGKYGVHVMARASGGEDVLCLKASFTI